MIVLPTSITDSNYKQTHKLAGVDYEFIYQWSQRDGRWYISIYKDDEAVITGRRVVANTPLYPRRELPFPQGILAAIDLSEAGTDPGLADLGDRVVMCFEEYDG